MTIVLPRRLGHTRFSLVEGLPELQLVAYYELADNTDLTTGTGPNGTPNGSPSFSLVGPLDDEHSHVVGDAALTSVAGTAGTWTGSASWPVIAAGRRFEISDHSNPDNDGLWVATGSPTTSSVPATKLTGGTPANASAEAIGVHVGSSMYGGSDVYFSLPSGDAGLALSNFPDGMLIRLLALPETLPTDANRVQTLAAGNSSAAGHLSLCEIRATDVRSYIVDADGIQWFGGVPGGGVPGFTPVAGRTIEIIASFGSNGAKLWLDKALVATLTTTQLPTNIARFLKSWITGAAQFVMPGAIGKLAFYNGQATQERVDAFPNARTPLISPPPEAEFITTPEAHGWSDSASSYAQHLTNTAAFNTAVAAASANAATSVTGRGVVELVQGKVYALVEASNGAANVPVGCVELNASVPNVHIRTQGSPTAQANKAILRHFDWAATRTGFGSDVHNRSLIHLAKAANCRVTHVRVDGNKWSIGADQTAAEAFLANDISYAAADNGGLHCIADRGSTNTVLEHVEAYDALVDSISIDRFDSDATRTTSFQALDCDFHHSRRQAFSFITGGLVAGGTGQIQFTDCDFRNTGDDSSGGYLLRGEAPGSNFDCEPNNSGDTCYGLRFTRCDFANSAGSTFELGSVRSATTGRGVTYNTRAVCIDHEFIDCTFTGNRGAGWHAFLANGISFTNLTITNPVFSGNNIAADPAQFWFDPFNGTGSLWTNVTIINASVPVIRFDPTETTGHSVTIWLGEFNPTITRPNNEQTVTVNNGLPDDETSTGVTAVVPDTDNTPTGVRYGAPGWLNRSGFVVALAGRTSEPMNVWDDPRRVGSGSKANAEYEFRATGGGTFPGGTWAKDASGDLVFTSDGSTGVKSGEYRMRGNTGSAQDEWSAWTPIRIEGIARPSGTLVDVEAQSGANDSIKLQNAFEAAFAVGGTAVVYSSLGLARQYILGHDGRFIRHRHPRVRMFDLHIKRITPTYLGGNAAAASNYNGLHRRFDSMLNGHTTAADDTNWTNSATAFEAVNCIIDGNGFDQPICQYSGAGGTPSGTPGNVDSGGFGWPGQPPGIDHFNIQLAFGFNIGGTWSAGTSTTQLNFIGCKFIHFTGEGVAVHAGHQLTAKYCRGSANQRGIMTKVRQGGSFTFERCEDRTTSERAGRPFLHGENGSPAAAWDTAREIGGGVDMEPENQTVAITMNFTKCFIESGCDFGRQPIIHTINMTDVNSARCNMPAIIWTSEKNAVTTMTRCALVTHKLGANKGSNLTLAGADNQPTAYSTGGRMLIRNTVWYMGNPIRSFASHGRRHEIKTGTQCGWAYLGASGNRYFQHDVRDTQYRRLVPPGISLGSCFALWMSTGVVGLADQGSDPHVILGGHISFESGFAQFPFRGSAGSIIRILAGTTFAHADFPGATTFWSNFATVQDQR